MQGVFTFINSTTRCTKCGSKARILDGVYNLVEDIESFITNNSFSQSDLQKIQEILESTKTTEKPIENAASKIETEISEEPKFYKFAALIRKFEDDPAGTGSLIVALISLLITFTQLGSNRDKPDFKQYIIQNQITINKTLVIEEKQPTIESDLEIKKILSKKSKTRKSQSKKKGFNPKKVDRE